MMTLVLDIVSAERNSNVSQILICFSHLRWKFVTQRPQHLMSRLATTFDVLYWEEPVRDGEVPRLELSACEKSGVRIAVPHLPEDVADEEGALRDLLDRYLANESRPILRWFYTPMMLPFSRHLTARCTIYDCMDELANFRFASSEIGRLEAELFEVADVVFTGGHSLYEAKRSKHPNIHPFPSSVDIEHFSTARGLIPERKSRPTIGFYGVIDERMDAALIEAVARARPNWAIEMVGPVVKIDPAGLPDLPNIFWMGAADYDDLPAVLARWDVAIMPFAINPATQFISPTKTPEYLAAGRPVVSTPIADVMRHYGDLSGVRIAGDATAFVAAVEELLDLAQQDGWLGPVDAVLEDMSWDSTAEAMTALIAAAGERRAKLSVRVPEHYDALVVGAGFAGTVMAERLAADAGMKVLVVDRRDHIAGNAYDRYDDAGLLIHQYGPHIFHTNSAEIFAYLSRFTRWRPYEHRVLAAVGNNLVPMPINRSTLNMLYNINLDSEEAAAAFLAARAEPVSVVRTSEDVVISAIGRELYETFFRGYTRKQWGLDPSELDKSVTARVPTRTNTDDRYFTDQYQAMPQDGYTAMFASMLSHPNISVRLGVDYRDLGPEITFDHTVYTGPIDEFYGYRFGKLPYRSLRFRHATVDNAQFQEVGTVNYPAETVPYTRITEYKHLTGQVHGRTSITFEYPCAEGDPYYPIPRAENLQLYKRYEALGDAESDVTFVGRLATYRYYNMDQVVGQALAAYRRLRKKLPCQTQEVPLTAA
jgi:UDP-galactopyranose mutase